MGLRYVPSDWAPKCPRRSSIERAAVGLIAYAWESSGTTSGKTDHSPKQSNAGPDESLNECASLNDVSARIPPEKQSRFVCTMRRSCRHSLPALLSLDCVLKFAEIDVATFPGGVQRIQAYSIAAVGAPSQSAWFSHLGKCQAIQAVAEMR
jgi:hypothetical protein